MATKDLGRAVTRRVGVLTSKAGRRGLLALAALLCGGCGYVDLLEDYPVSEAVFYTTGVAAGAPVALGMAPVTIPLAAYGDGGCKDLAVPFLPGIAVGGLVGAVAASPFLLCESLVHGIGDVLRGRRRHGDACAGVEAGGYSDSVCPYCGTFEGGCDWGLTCAPPPAPSEADVEAGLDAALRRSLEQAWPPAEEGPPVEGRQPAEEGPPAEAPPEPAGLASPPAAPLERGSCER